MFFEDAVAFFALDIDVCAWADEVYLMVQHLVEGFSKHDFGKYSKDNIHFGIKHIVLIYFVHFVYDIRHDTILVVQHVSLALDWVIIGRGGLNFIKSLEQSFMRELFWFCKFILGRGLERLAHCVLKRVLFFFLCGGGRCYSYAWLYIDTTSFFKLCSWLAFVLLCNSLADYFMVGSCFEWKRGHWRFHQVLRLVLHYIIDWLKNFEIYKLMIIHLCQTVIKLFNRMFAGILTARKIVGTTRQTLKFALRNILKFCVLIYVSLWFWLFCTCLMQ